MGRIWVVRKCHRFLSSVSCQTSFATPYDRVSILFVLFLQTLHSNRWQAECGQISVLNQLITDTTSCIFHTRVDMNHWFFSYYKFKQAFFIFHDEHYKLYISYQRWYESMLYPLWIITRGHFCESTHVNFHFLCFLQFWHLILNLF